MHSYAARPAPRPTPKVQRPILTREDVGCPPACAKYAEDAYACLDCWLVTLDAGPRLVAP